MNSTYRTIAHRAHGLISLGPLDIFLVLVCFVALTATVHLLVGVFGASLLAAVFFVHQKRQHGRRDHLGTFLRSRQTPQKLPPFGKDTTFKAYLGGDT